MAHQSLYRRYRPQRFSEVRGQDDVVGALRSAVADERVGHAYLFSGPRGTGKTSTARILAKALNCEALVDGEPCGTCESCVAIQAGRSYDLQELDAASNNKVEDVRSLIERVALGSPGRTKVYILDEVHMLSAGASNALLKTLEEPPDHVVFVLATTDPQKVLPTIRSRTQHYQFHLLPATDLADHVRWVISDAGLDVDDAAVEQVLRAGGGSARDTLSALDQAAAGGVGGDADHVDALAEAVVATDTAAALTAVATATVAGRDPRVLGEGLLAHLRDVFLLRMGGPVSHLSDVAHARVEGWAARVTDRSVTRALEEVGEALLTMRQAPDARIPLEVALVRLTRSGGDGAAGGGGADLVDLADLVARVERLERGAPATAPSPGDAAPTRGAAPQPAEADRSPTDGPGEPTSPSSASPSGPSGSGREAARAAVARGRSGPSGGSPASSSERGAAPPPPPPARGAPPVVDTPPTPPTPDLDPEPGPEAGGSAGRPADGDPAAAVEPRPLRSVPTPAPDPDPAPAGASEATAAADDDAAPGEATAASDDDDAAPGDGDSVSLLWRERVVPGLRGMTKALFKLGQVVGHDDDTVTVGLPNRAHLERCEQKRDEAEDALVKALGRPVRLELVVGGDADDDGGGGDRSPRPDRPAGPAADEHVDLDDLVDAPTDARTTVDRVTDAFPGARVVDP